MNTIEIVRTMADFGFDAKDEAGHVIKMDTSDDGGGTNYGARPMQTLLMGLGGCSGIDVVSIMKKQRQELTHFKMIIQGQREADKIPALWEKVHIIFELGGNQLDEAKARQAITLSMDKYCSVAETLRRAGATITWELKILDV